MERLTALLLAVILLLVFSASAENMREIPAKVVPVTATPRPTPSPVPSASVKPAENDGMPSGSVPAPAAETAAPTAAPLQTTSVLLSLAGDCTLGSDEPLHGEDDSFVGTLRRLGYDYSYPLALAQPLFSSDDFTLVNLEGVLTDRADLRNTDLYLNFRGPAEFVNILTLGSVEGVSMSNNHALDYGSSGLEDCQWVLDEAGIQWAYNNNYFIFERNGIRFAVFSFRRYYMEVYYEWLESAIPQVKKEENVDFVIVCLHHGEEYEVLHNDHDQTRFARHAIDCGADLIVGTHPHVLQGIEIYRSRLILYSLGNFSFGGNNRPFEESIPTAVVQVLLTFDQNSHRLYSTEYTIWPYHATGTTPYSNYQPVPVTGAEAREVMAIIQNDTPFPLRPFTEGKGAVQDIIYAR
ncbi:MAG: CapA family protein [Clostridia bacterium]|nr:CapA family protein [Clostridia bacterium]